MSGHLVVVGCTTTVVRLVDELQRAGERVVVVVPGEPEGWVAGDLREVAREVVRARVVREPALREAGVEQARAVVILGQTDVEALRLALLVEEVAPGARLVLEMRRSVISHRLGELLGDCVVLSTAQLAAPSFVAATLASGAVETFEFGGRQVVAGTRDRVGGPPLAVLGDSRTTSVSGLLDTHGDVVLGTEVLPSGRPQARQSGFWGALAQVIDVRARVVLLVLVGLMVVSTLFFRFVAGLDWIMAVYAALTASTLTGIGDVGDLSLPARFGAVSIQMAGLVLSSGLTAVIVDAMISARLSDLAGGVRGRPKNHVVVCGLGRVGTAVALSLKASGVPVVALEAKHDGLGVEEARRARIPVVVADATHPAAMQAAGIARAAAVVAVTDVDAANLEISMVARDARPDVRVVTRLFDHELAARVEQRLQLGTTRSVSMVAAPMVAAAALGHRLEHVVSVGRRVLVLSEVELAPGCPAVGETSAAIEEPHHLRVLAVRPVGGQWDWQPTGRPLVAGDVLAVAASRLGQSRLWQLTDAGPVAGAGD